MSFLLDTDICSAHLKQKGSLTHRFIQHAGNLYVSAITVGELCTWTSRAKTPLQRSQSLDALLADLQILEIDEPIARCFGKVRAALLDAGMPVPEMDLMIASTALTHNLTLVTHNVSDYAHIPGLRIDDWLTP